jgi:tRNA(fMet)-specific endonuclease VapC
MSFLLDTNVWVEYLRKGKRSPVAQKIQSLAAGEIRSCSVVFAELVYGALRSQHVEKNLAEVNRLFKGIDSLPLDDAAAKSFAKIRRELEPVGKGIGPFDMMIAAIALSHGMTLVTHNIREFSRIAGLKSKIGKPAVKSKKLHIPSP